MAEPVDADTLARAQRGDPAACRAVVDAGVDEVVAIVGDPAAAEEVLVQVVRDLPKYALGADKLAVWIRTRATRRGRVEPAPDAPAPDRAAIVDRVLQRRETAAAPEARRGFGTAAVVVAAACIGVLALAVMRAPDPPATGAVTATERVEVRIGPSVAVVEAGAAVSWRGRAIDQRAGNVFYRIDAPVAITTPHGRITTARASLRVVVGATTAVTVDEGDAMVGAARVGAGGQATLP